MNYIYEIDRMVISELEYMALVFLSAKDMQYLNKYYRDKAYPTNVLSFPSEIDGNHDLGDVFLCMEIIEKEAQEQKKSLLAHVVHLIIHGILHLKGYDHETSQEAKEMEALETQYLIAMGFEDPYAPLETV